ncbi:hypothetical protein E6C76_08660 [Pseudothauera nasutitermitis]|uniref:Uncharacterized protein n=1 Tax=Pseudothauera nasutitermitis TaxID=2565930 RepID=A0A4S4AZP0_9RHOO|nr:hypothetical protein [Pseudothauera nasutitermitis]THF65631.1 hypothetical protein E6C76_08660 [Pseudothauera nasutitermitis]
MKRGLLLFASLLALACSPPPGTPPIDDPALARQIAERWMADNIDELASYMAAELSTDFSALLRPVLAAAVKHGMHYSYHPSRLDERTWQVRVEAFNSFDLSPFGVSKDVSAKARFDLAIDAQSHAVRSYSFKPSDMGFTFTAR